MGASALAKRLPEWPGCYACPICLRLFGTPEGLTLEHVPPASVGGVVICLTCAACNKEAGYQLDSNLAKEDEVRAINQLKRGNVQLVLSDGTVINTALSDAQDKAIALAIRRENPPEVLGKEFWDRINSLFHDGAEFKIRVSYKFSQRKANISRLRAAYLLAFAKYGYHYVLRNSMSNIRQQIRFPDRSVLPDRWICRIDDTDRSILLATRPFGLTVVRYDNAAVFLPGVRDHDGQQYAEFLALQGPSIELSSCSRDEWPGTMEMAWDIQVH